MLYSTSSHKAGGSGFFFEDDKNAPSDAVFVSSADVTTAINLSAGATYNFDAAGKLSVINPTSSDLIARAKALQADKVQAACAAAIVAGFTSSALGAERTYGSKLSDQNDLLNAALASQGQISTWTAFLWCAEDGTWTYSAHTAAQVQQVNADWLAYRQAHQKKYADLIAQISQAPTVDDVEKIVW
ncbi:hypothetical protein HF908_08905 [Ralstonia pseudosolanacearum]|uniref:DUF4376 domain-containing protein n=1 Tax=Ralstonia pseudosolanacearum TaxID=1310165 RepID=UPI0018680228|nr:hypothetical protein [Ralstonia pseudosolanacearum]QOK91586.1 hypothetical protein HF908_08905 [Ralstonia pseudosolanacearum]